MKMQNKMKELILINKLKEYEYFLIPSNEGFFKIKFDSEKEFKHIKRIINKVYLNDTEGFNNFNFEYDRNYIFIKLKYQNKENHPFKEEN